MKIWIKEQLTEETKKPLADAINRFYEANYTSKPSFEEKMQRDANAVLINGKWYDRRFLNGGETK